MIAIKKTKRTLLKSLSAGEEKTDDTIIHGIETFNTKFVSFLLKSESIILIRYNKLMERLMTPHMVDV